jgi:hyperosmotically inducible protein
MGIPQGNAMTALRSLIVGVALLAVLGTAERAAGGSVGQMIDDTAITTQVKARLALDKLSTLTRIEVTTTSGIVTLAGVVDEPERKARAAQIASAVDGVKGIVNRIHVSGSTVAAAPPPPITGPGAVDATGVVSSVDAVAGTITLQDGRVLRATGDTVVWQASPLGDLRPGSQVLVRGAAPLGVQPVVTTVPPEWRMGTVSRVDHAASQLVLTDGAVVRVSPATVLHRRGTRVSLDEVTAGAEVVVRTQPPRTVSAEGSALPGSRPATGWLDASEINVVWTPVEGSR